MNKQITLHNLMQEELERCLQYKDSQENRDYPRGSIIERNGSYYRCVRENGRQFHVQLSVKENDLLEGLKKRRFSSVETRIINRHIQACREFLTHDVLYDPIHIKESLPQIYRGLSLDDFLLDGDIDPEKWEAEDYLKNRFHPEALRHSTPGGLMVRSKSEAMIAATLEQLEIPFRYEPVINLEGVTYAPDFEILLTGRRMLVYWEHLGMVENTEYIMSALNKLSSYGRGGLLLGQNLFITYETLENPLTFKQINGTIQEILALDSFEW